MNGLVDLLALTPELLLLAGACVALIIGASGRESSARLVSPVVLITIAAAFGFSLTFDIDNVVTPVPGLWLTSLTYYTRLVTLGVGALIVLVNWSQSAVVERGEYMALLLLSLLGVLLTASANDLLVLFLAIELVSVPTYVMIALSREDARASESAVKYFFLGAMSAAILAYGFSFMYGLAGTTLLQVVKDGAIVSTWATGAAFGPLAVVGLILILGGLAFKVAAVPFHVYAPDVYEGAASPMTGMLGFVPKLAGFIALIKIMAALNWDLPPAIHWVLWLMAAGSMTFGNVLALLQRNVKRMLAYSSVAHTGYMLLALLIGPVAGQGPMRDGVSALLFYMTVYGLMNLGAFAVLTCFGKGSREMETLDDVAGLSKRAPAAALALAVCVFSLMGFPPTAGFLGKLYIFSSAFSLEAAHPFRGPVLALAIIGVVNTALGAAYYLRIVSAAYVRDEVEVSTPLGGQPPRSALALCAVPMIVLFVRPGWLADQTRDATTVLHRSIQTGIVRVTENRLPAEDFAAGDKLASHDKAGVDTGALKSAEAPLP